MKKYLKFLFSTGTLFILTISMFAGCIQSDSSTNKKGTSQLKNTLTILSASENKALDPIIQDFAKKNGVNIEMHYKGSVDIMNALKENNIAEDAVWPANSIWISMGDEKHRVKYNQSIMTSPVVFGIKKSKAQELGFVGKNVSIKDILNATEQGKLQFMMTSASQSNSGASAYIGFLYSFLGNPDNITLSDLQKPDLKGNIKKLLSGVNRSSGSSDWLKDLFLSGNYEAMVNYESVIIETNKQLIKEGKEPLYAVYPYDGLTIADSPLGYIDKDDSNKENIFKKLQSFLLSQPTQQKILALGRRTGIGGTVQNPDKSVFNPDWGIDAEKAISPIKYPAPDVIQEALNLYQSEFRKPSYMIFCIDYSGSMESNGGNSGVKQAMNTLLNSDKAKQYMLQLTDQDKVVVIPFSGKVISEWKADGNNNLQIQNLISNINNLRPSGSTDIYSPVIQGLKELNDVDLSNYIPSIILMTDGQSNTGKNIGDLKQLLKDKNKDIPVFSITFGDADSSQLKGISDLTRGTVFDGKSDLINAFKQARGYN